jgi:hypothetical protein
MKHVFFTSVILLSALGAHAQHTVSGIVKDNAGAVSAVTISLLHAADSSWVQSELSDEQGGFSFQDVKDGKYLLDARLLGYERYLMPLEKWKGIEIILTRSLSQLKEVVVKSKAPVIQTEMGKMTVNFEQANISAGSNVLELLRKAPGVAVDGNGNVSMGGKGVLITIDDKQTYMAGEDLVNYLKALPAEQVAQLDLMSQPSAKYDAEGNTGIINIKTRKSKKAGLSGNVALSGGMGEYPSTHNSANITYRKDKLTLQANAGYLLGNGFLRHRQQRSFKDVNTNAITGTLDQKSFQQETFEDYNLRLAADYAANHKLTFGGSVQGIYHPNNQLDRSEATITDRTTGDITYNRSDNDRGFVRYNTNTTAYTKYVPAKDQTITGELTYRTSDQQDGQLLQSRNYNKYMMSQPDGLTLRSKYPLTMDVYVGNVDYAGTVGKDMKLEGGVKSVYLANEIGSINDIQHNGVWEYDSLRSNNYLYNENINAAYISASKSLSEKWQAQLGLRVENTNIYGLQEASGAELDRSFTSCFPTAFVSYKANEKNTLEMNAGRRISRPSYRDLNPFVFYLSQYNSSGGNPNLLPSYRYRVELTHNYDNKLISSIACSRAYDLINDATLYDAVTKAVHFTKQNNANKWVATFSVSYNQQIVPWWTLMTSYNWYYNDYEDYNGNSIAHSHGHSFAIGNQFNYKGWSVDTFYAFNSGDLQSSIERNGPSHWMNASVGKKIWKDTATIKLSADDPFAVYRYTTTQELQAVNIKGKGQFATQGFSLGFTYNIGKKMDNIREQNSNSEEARRM